jgi:hypothetical protein
MQAHFPIGSCCARPQVKFVGGMDEDWPASSSEARRIVRAVRMIAGNALRVVYGRVLESISRLTI